MQAVIYFLVWGLVFIVLMRLGCGGHIMGHRHARSRTNDNDALSKPPEKAIDPVCGMTVSTAEARSSVYDGRVSYFCSQDCREKFEASPPSYSENKAAQEP